jgi:hypothetical protein
MNSSALLQKMSAAQSPGIRTKQGPGPGFRIKEATKEQKNPVAT